MPEPTRELFSEDPYLRECRATVREVAENGVLLDQTVFYPEGGGQVGDIGRLDDLRVIDTQRRQGGILHLTDAPPALSVGDGVDAEIDWPRRHTIMRHHTLLHLCHLAAVELLGEEPRLIGSQVREEKARLDYDTHRDLDAGAIREAVERLIAADLPVTTEPVPGGGLTEEGAPERRWSIPGYDPIPCGGTHVKSTGEIGPIKVKVQRKGSQGTRVYCNVLEPG
jgi:Ser-tRNA(Ala) deacylase AlaX